MTSVYVKSHVINLYLVTFIRGQPPIVSRVACIQSGKTNQDARVVGAASGKRDVRCGVEGEPIDLKDKIPEDLPRVPEHTQAVRLRLQDRAEEREKIPASGHLPALTRSSEQWLERWTRGEGPTDDDGVRRPAGECGRSEGRVGRADDREQRGTGNVGVGEVVELAERVGY